MPRSRSYSRSPSRSSNKKSSRRSRSREKYSSSSRRRSSSRSRSKKLSNRYKSPSSRRRSRSRSGERRRKSKYYSSSKKDYRRERSRSRDRDRYGSKRRSRSSSSSSRSASSSESASSTSTVASKISIKSEKELQVIPLKMPSQPVVPTKNTLKFSSVDLVGEDFVKPEVIEELNADEFIPKAFQSAGKKHLPDNIKIDLSSESVSITTKSEEVADKKPKQEEEDSIFHPNLFGDEAVRMDKWVRKLFTYRQKMFLAEN